VALIALALLVLPTIAWIALPSVQLAAPGAGASAPVAARTAAEPTDEPAPAAGSRKLAGHVRDSAGNGVDAATVTLEVDGHTIRDIDTHGGGAFSLSAPVSKVTLVVRAKGYAAARLEVAPGGPEPDLEIRLRTAGAVSGLVVDGKGKPVAGAYVECDGSGDMFATSDDEGHFKLPADADGCRATATHADYGTSRPIALTEGDRNTIEMPSPGGISGVVVDEGGRPVTKYLIGIESFQPVAGAPTGPWVRNERIDDPSGAFSLDQLAAGKYVLVASAEGRPPAKSDAIDLEAGRTESGVRIVLTKGGSLSGVVSERGSGKPIANARVRLDALTSTGATAIPAAVTDDSGHYHLDGIPSGPFSVRVSHGDYTARIVSLDGSASHDLHQDVDLAPAGDGPSTEMTGIGATLAKGPTFVEVAGVLAGGPAEAAGLKTGDRIERIDGANAEGFTVSDCVQRLRGPEGTRVTVTLGRGTGTVEVTITRAKIVR
jgi:hypothetical protein